MSDIQSRIAALSPAKRALLERSLRENADRQESKSIRPRRPEEKPLLSFGQQRLWILEQWQPGAAAYNISTVARIEGPLDTAALQRSLTEVVRRHETLRTTFAPGGDLPALIIHTPGVVEVQRVDLTALPEEQKESMAFEQMNAEVLRGFDLMTGPMFRCTLLQLAPQSHLLLLKVHHIVFDGWSMGLLYRELFTLYDAFAGGHSSPLSEPPVQYADFAAWQRRRLQGDLLSKVLNYWREQLRDLPTLDLPIDRPRPPGQTFIGATQNIYLRPILVAALKSLSRQEGATLFMTLLAAFQILLHRYSGQDDLVVGTPIAGRTRAEVEELLGFFVNMLVLRTDASGDPSFRELLARTNKTALGAYAHQDLPFEKLVEELHPRRDPSRNPLFQVVFALQNMPHSSPAFGRVHVTRVNLEKTTTRFDLEVHLQDVDEGLAGVFVYNTALFEAETIARMTKHFQTVLEAVATNPGLRLSEAPLLAEEERRQLLVDWNDTGTPYPRDTGVASLFEARAQATPDALAVTFGKQRMTYRQLNERANRLGRHLRTLGVGRDVLAGICVERSLDMIVGMLGILKAGGAYVPIEPSYPRERVAFMLRDANVRVLLTYENLARNLPETHVHVVHLDDRRFDNGNSDNPDSGTAAADIACVIYTSGSTGQPKGVAVPHRAVVRLVLNTNYAQLGPADRVAQGSNSSFDAATFEIWGALLNGAALIGIPQAVLLSPKDFARELQEQKITTLFLTTALFNQMAISAPTMFDSLRYLLVGGEAFDMNSGRRVLRHGAPQHLLNAYGPTESATFATWHRVQNSDSTTTTAPIGRPISNTTVYVLDRRLQPVPIGVTGELYIGGDGVAREYLNRPELTAERFIPDPFSRDPAARLFKTGDLVRYLPGGSLDFVGRMDRQVKIRGFRIEPQEIESILSLHPGVRESAVIARRKDDGENRLLAYVVPSGARRPSTGELRQFLSEKLPAYMTPSAFVVLDSLPLTPSGKLDRGALPEPEQIAFQSGPPAAEPRTAIEEALVDIWQTLLGVSRVSIHDNFFDLGGHSLLAIRVAAQIEKRFGKTLPVAVLFQSPTIEQLAILLDN